MMSMLQDTFRLGSVNGRGWPCRGSRGGHHALGMHWGLVSGSSPVLGFST